MHIAIYNENCTQAGREVSDRDAEEYEDSPNGLEDFGDCSVYEGAPGELLYTADLREKNARTGGGGTYDRRVAETIRQAVYDAHPELEPVAEDDD
jgi:hypothetical protein